MDLEKHKALWLYKVIQWQCADDSLQYLCLSIFCFAGSRSESDCPFFYLLFLGKQKCPQLNEHSTVSINDKSENQQVNRHLLNQNEVQSRIASK